MTRLVLCSALVLASGAVHAQWEITPSVYTSVLHTDNIGLQNDENKLDEISYEVSPRLILNHTGPRFRMNSNYQLQARQFKEFDENNQIFHNLDMNASMVLLRDKAGVDFLANIQQQIVDRQFGVGGTTASRIGNLADINTYSVQPYFNFDAGRSTTGRVSYRLGLSEFDRPELIDSKNDQLLATVTTQQLGGSLTVGGTFTRSGVEFDTGREVTLQRTAVDLSYRLTPRTDFVLQAGEDSNDLGSLPILSDIEGSFWMAGLSGSLGSATTYDARVGEQFFGNSVQLSISRQRNRLALDLSYVEQASTFGGGQINPAQLLGLVSGFGGTDLPNSTQDVFISNRLTFGLTYTLTRSALRISVFNDNREFLTGLDDDGQDDRGGGAQVSWNWELSADTQLSLLANYQRFLIRQTDDEPEDLRVEATWRRSIFDGAYMDFRYIRNERDSNNELLNFSENTFQLGVGYEF